MTQNQVYDYDSRHRSALDLIKDSKHLFSSIGPDKWTYKGSKGETYEIDTKLKTCTCPDHVYRCMGHSDQPCKHLIVVSMLEETLKKIVKTEVKTD